MYPFPYLHQHWRTTAAAAAGLTATVGLAAWYVRSRRLTAEQIEARRRLRIAGSGRIIDGLVVGALPEQAERATVVFYTYRVAGVRYECSQDLTALEEYVQPVVLDGPIQVRYLPANPGNSIVLAETWNGLFTPVRSLPGGPS